CLVFALVAVPLGAQPRRGGRSEEHTSELQSRFDLVCRLLLEKKKGCRGAEDAGERRRAYPVTPEGARYTEAQALGCPAGSRTLLVEFSTAPRDIGPLEGRNLV